MTAPGGAPRPKMLVLGAEQIANDVLAALLSEHRYELVDAAPGTSGRDEPAVVVLVDPRPEDWARAGSRPAIVVTGGDRPVAAPADAAVRAVVPADTPLRDLLTVLDELMAHLVPDQPAAVHLGGPRNEPPRDVVALSPREEEILDAIDRGMSVKQTARALGIAPKTVENLQSRLFTKLGARNRAHAVFLAYDLGLLGVEPRAGAPAENEK